MKRIFLVIILCAGLSALRSQEVFIADPDSMLAEWVESGEWEGVSLNPDIAIDWLSEVNGLYAAERTEEWKGTHRFTINLPLHARIFKWISDSGDLVSPVSMKYRIRMSESRRWEFRFQIDQPAGDTCLQIPSNKVPVNVSAGFLVRPGWLFHEIIVGDFQVNSGFGVVTGSSPVFSVSLGNPGSLHRPGKGIRLHSGTYEGRYFRGLAINLAIGKTELILFGSGKDGINEEVAGMGLKRVFAASEFGISGIRIKTQFPPEIKEGWTAVWQPDSGVYSRIGIWGQSRVPFGIFFGEGGWSPNGGFGWITGFRFFEAHGFSAVIRYSGCSPGYPVAYTILQTGTGITREGQRATFSVKYARARRFEWLGLVEMELSQWPGSNVHFANTSTRISQQLKYSSKDQWITTGSLQVDFLEAAGSVPQKITWKVAFDSDPLQSGTLRFRAGFRQQLQVLALALTKGTTADCSLSLVLAGKKLRLTGGFRVFTVETGTDPLYSYEPDVMYGWSAPVLSGSGTRCFLTSRYRLFKKLDVEIKISQTVYSDLKHLNDANQGGISGKVQVGWLMK